MWIESHQELGRHPKTRKAARLLGISRVTMVGHLHFLWWWSLDFAQDGTLNNFDNDELAEAAEWEGDPDVFVAALVGAGFIEEPARALHDWHDYAGKLLEQRKANAEKQKRWRERNKTDTSPAPNPPVTVTSPLRNGATVPNRTVPNRTVPNLTQPKKESHDSLAAADAPRPTAPAPRPIRNIPKPKDEPHRPNPLWDALVEGVGITPTTTAERSKYGKVVRELRDMEATPEEVVRRCEHYRMHWPTIDLTVNALLEHWSRMEHPPAVRKLNVAGGKRPTVADHNEQAMREVFGDEPDDVSEVIEAAWRYHQQDPDAGSDSVLVAEVRGSAR